MTRVVIDANVLASATAGHPDSPSRRLLDALASGRIDAVLCDRILQELDHAPARASLFAVAVSFSQPLGAVVSVGDMRGATVGAWRAGH
jgi:predicted nucleic acid-binding protein